MSTTSNKKATGALSTVLKLVAPLAKKHITPESMQQVFHGITEKYEYPGERTMIVISRKGDGSVVGSVVGVDEDNRITSQYEQHPLAELLTQFISEQI